jgi:hypothetical protein
MNNFEMEQTDVYVSSSEGNNGIFISCLHKPSGFCVEINMNENRQNYNPAELREELLEALKNLVNSSQAYKKSKERENEK